MASQKSLSLILAVTCLSALRVNCDRGCPAPAPCTCSGIYVNCHDRNLDTVPAMIGDAATAYRLFLHSNRNLVITDSSFDNVSLEYLDLAYNTNMSISRDAFRNQKSSLNELDLSNANLKSVPEAIGDLKALRFLYIGSNSISQWNLKVMEKLGVSLTDVDISDSGLTSWPTWLKHMWNLHSLNVRDNPIGVIPPDAFDAFRSRLTYLNIENTGLTDLPTGLQSLPVLRELHVGGQTLTESSFYENWLPSQQPSLRSVFIINTTITKIPDGLGNQASLDELYIQHSRIRHVGEKSMPPNINTLYLTAGLVTRVQNGMCNPRLSKLELDGNRIESIERHDLDDCPSLFYFSADDNDIAYVSSGAFHNVSHLITLFLQKNKLERIPTAIGTLHSLGYVYLTENPIECTCETEWFTHWRKNNTHIKLVKGRCTNLDMGIVEFHSHCT